MRLYQLLIILFTNRFFCYADEQQNGWENVFANNLSTIPLHHFQGKSYYISTHIKLNYMEAFQFCKSIHMNLVSIKSQEENNKILEYIKNTSSSHFEYWTAGARFLDNYHWIWMSTGEPVEYTNWYLGNYGLGIESCLQLWFKGKAELMWKDRMCHDKLSFICERDTFENDKFMDFFKPNSDINWDDRTHNPSYLPANIHLLQGEGKQYFVSRHINVNFFQANQICQMINMQLVTIESEKENNILYKYIRDTTAGCFFWTGGVRFLDGIRWIWLPTGNPVEYTNWQVGEPTSNFEQCINLHYEPERGLLWSGNMCELGLKFICEKRADFEEHGYRFIQPRSKRSQLKVLHIKTSGSKLDVWQPFGSKNITEDTETGLFVDFKQKLTKDEAHEYCKGRKMHLVDISDSTENGKVKTSIQLSGLSEPFWTAGSKVKMTWKWNTTNTHLSYTNWDSGKPSDITHFGQDCLVVHINGKWSDVSCSKKYNVICESYPNIEPIVYDPILPPMPHPIQPTNPEPQQSNISISNAQGVFISNEQLEKIIQHLPLAQPPTVNVYVNNIVQTKDAEKVNSSEVFTSKNVTKSEKGYNVLINNNIDSNSKGKCTAREDDDIIPFLEERINE